MSRKILLVSLLVGSVLVAVVVSGPQSRADGPRRVTGASLTMLHSPRSAMATGVSRRDDHPCEESEKEGERDRRIRRGFEVAPVLLDLEGKDCGLVGLGSYLVNAVSGCNECHTNPPYTPEGDPFKGLPKQVNAEHYLAGGIHFGPFISRNITPDEDGLPAGLTFDQFLEMFRKGTDFHNLHPQISPLLQVMPWPAYQGMKRRDIQAMYEYLSAIPCVEGPPDLPPHTCN